MVRVLTVDDYPPFLEMAHALLVATPGFEPTAEVGSGEEGLAAIREEVPDLVLVDVHLPGMDGIELTRRIRASERAPVVVLISTEDPSRLPAAARSCGAAAVISKHELAPARLRQLWQAHGQPVAE
ncbi:response regulator transcription factor [Pseudonocardia sp. T1-2H]|uniref:response regulator transcription factor n=1 Tax=Pseudonocardia sp. T1-2H TaxID=3128899 RepID=UPI0031013665